MDEIPAGAIPVDQFEVMPQAHPDDIHAASMPGAIPVDSFESQEEAYGTDGQVIKAGLEGLAQGVAGPLATGIETALGVKKEDILGRQRENPITHGVGEGLGLVGSSLYGVGEAAVMSKAGKLAEAASGLSKVSEAADLARSMQRVGQGVNLDRAAATAAADAVNGVTLSHRVGSSAVQQAVEMAVLQAGDETSKLLLDDPEASAESAISNVGLAAALGGAGGAFITGAVSPLWHATAGPKLEGLLNGLTDHLNGSAGIIPEKTEQALTTLGIDAAPEIRAGLSGNPAAVNRFNVLKEVQNKDILAGIDKLNNDASESVMKSLGVPTQAVEHYSENEAGHELLDTFKREYKDKYEPIAEALEKRNSEAAGIHIPDEARMNTYGHLLEKGMETVGTDTPYYKLYEEYGQRLIARDTVGALDKVKTEINNRIKGLKIGGDYNVINALNDIKSTIGDFQERQIAKSVSLKDMEREALFKESGKMAGMGKKEALEGFEKTTGDIVNQRAETNRRYSEFAKMSDELTNHLGIGDFHGAGSLAGKLTDKIAAEDLLKKFSIRGNQDFLPFLEKNFPETLQHVRENELKKLLKPAILGAKGENPVNIKKLHDIVSKAMAGQKDYVDAILPRGALERIEAAKALHEAMPNPKSSGTAGWMTKTFAKMPSSAMAAVAMLTSHNPVMGYILGETAQHLGRTAPDAISLAYLKFLGSNQPVKAGAFRAMVEFFHNTAKGVNFLSKASSAVFKSGAQVLTAEQMPSKADTEKLDKLVTKFQDAPDQIYSLQKGETGHYLPDHQAGLTEVSTRALQYLQTLKPQPVRLSPLDKEIPPDKASIARYNRALEIAQQPAVVLQHIKQGTLQASDIKDLGAMYPGLYKHLADRLSANMTNTHADKEPIPYKTRMGLSLFLDQPLDSTMQPQSIQAAQATYFGKPNLGPAAQGPGKPNQATANSMNKRTNDYKTPMQAAEGRKSNPK